MGRENDANDASRDDARDATRRDALELVHAFDADELDDLTAELLERGLVDDREDDQPGSPWRLPPRDDDETERGRARIRELKDRLRELRSEEP